MQGSGEVTNPRPGWSMSEMAPSPEALFESLSYCFKNHGKWKRRVLRSSPSNGDPLFIGGALGSNKKKRIRWLTPPNPLLLGQGVPKFPVLVVFNS